MAPWPTAGRKSSVSSTAVTCPARPSRRRPASARSVASTSPRSSFASLVPTLPRRRVTRRSGLRRRSCAWRRSDADPTTAPCGRSVMLPARRLMKASRTSSPRREREVLGGMHREVDRALEERDVELLREQALAAGLRERSILDRVAGGLDDAQRQLVGREAVRAAQPVLRLVRLRERQGRAAGADDQGRGWPHVLLRDL